MQSFDNDQIILEETPRDFRTEIPNIIMEMVSQGNLTNSALILYLTYRRIAGTNGACWNGTRRLVGLTQLSAPTITKAKRELSKPFLHLNGKPLIKITKGDKKKEEADIVTIVDVWPENFRYFKNKLRVKKEDTTMCKNKTHKKEPMKKDCFVCVDSAAVAATPHKNTEEKIAIKLPKGKATLLSKQEYYDRVNKTDWTTEEVEEAWRILSNYEKPIRDWFKFVEGVIRNTKKLRSLKKQKEFYQRKRQCTTKSEKQEEQPMMRISGGVSKRSKAQSGNDTLPRSSVDWSSVMPRRNDY